MVARGIRNNNPGNIEKGGFLGELPDGPDPRFGVYSEPVYGLRAIMYLILKYQRKRGLTTTRAIINRWAPPMENDTGAYVKAVAKQVGVGPDDAVNLTDKLTLVNFAKAIVTHENGSNPYPDELFDRAAVMLLAT